MKTKQKTTLLIDASVIVYSAFHTYGTLNYHGQKTGIIYGFLKKILTLAKKFETTDFIICWDAGVSHRHSIYPIYKGNRHTNMTPEEKEERGWMLAQSVSINHRIMPYMGFKNNFIQHQYEADDLLAHWVHRLKGSGRRVIMVTTDSDMFQCLDDCTIYNTTTKKLFTRIKFMKKFGIRPDQWALAKAIGGCKGDNVIGVKGVSDPKSPSSKALKYIRGELNKGVVLDRIEAFKRLGKIDFNLKLVKLPYNVEPKRMIYRRNKFSRRRFIKIFDKYHFKSLLEKDKFAEWKEAFLDGRG